jgi:hypothetical protein
MDHPTAGSTRFARKPGSHRSCSRRYHLWCAKIPTPTWCWACRRPPPWVRSPTPTAPGYAPSTPTHVRHRHRTPTTNTYDNCWPPTPCSVTPPAEPTTTAQPPTPPYHTAQQGRHRLTGPSPARSRSRSRTATPPPRQPTSQHRHCGPARCAAIGSNDPAKPYRAHLNRLEPMGGWTVPRAAIGVHGDSDTEF